MQKNNILNVKNLYISFNNDKIIDDLCFDLSSGEILTILGPNGSGKTVLLKALLGLIPYQGKIEWDKKYKIGYLPQGLNQLLTKGLPLTVQDFFNLKNTKLKNNQIIEHLLAVGLKKEILNKITGNLSGGEFQRMLLAWVLAGDPEIIFLDEPTTGIDLGGGETIYSLLKKIQQERLLTIVLITHDLNIVYGFTDKVLCLSLKKHICFGEPRQILSPKTLEEIFGTKLKFYEHK